MSFQYPTQAMLQYTSPQMIQRSSSWMGVITLKPRLPLLRSVVLNEDSVFCAVTLVLDHFLTFHSLL